MKNSLLSGYLNALIALGLIAPVTRVYAQEYATQRALKTLRTTGARGLYGAASGVKRAYEGAATGLKRIGTGFSLGKEKLISRAKKEHALVIAGTRAALKRTRGQSLTTKEQEYLRSFEKRALALSLLITILGGTWFYKRRPTPPPPAPPVPPTAPSTTTITPTPPLPPRDRYYDPVTRQFLEASPLSPSLLISEEQEKRRKQQEEERKKEKQREQTEVPLTEKEKKEFPWLLTPPLPGSRPLPPTPSKKVVTASQLGSAQLKKVVKEEKMEERKTGGFAPVESQIEKAARLKAEEEERKKFDPTISVIAGEAAWTKDVQEEEKRKQREQEAAKPALWKKEVTFTSFPPASPAVTPTGPTTVGRPSIPFGTESTIEKLHKVREGVEPEEESEEEEEFFD